MASKDTAAELRDLFDPHLWRWATRTSPAPIGTAAVGFALHPVTSTDVPKRSAWSARHRCPRRAMRASRSIKWSRRSTPSGAPASAPLLQGMMAYRNDADLEFDLPGLSARIEPVDTRIARFDLRFEVRDHRAGGGALAGGLSGSLRYALDLFEAANGRGDGPQLLRRSDRARGRCGPSNSRAAPELMTGRRPPVAGQRSTAHQGLSRATGGGR